MGHTLFLCVSLLGAQGSEGQVVDAPQVPCASCQAAQAQGQPQPSRGPLGLGIWDRLRQRNEDDGPGLFARIRSMFAHPQQQPELGSPIPETVAPNGAPAIRNTSGEPPIINLPNVSSSSRMPSPSQPGTIPANYESPGVQTSSNSSNKYLEMSGHESDYSWVTGQIRQVNGNWIIEYASPGVVDEFGGKLVLTHIDTRNLQNGDFVCVTGSLLGTGGQAAYRVSAINLIERPKQ